MADIKNYSPRSGRQIKDNGTVVNTAEMIEAIYNGLIVNKNAGFQLTGSNALKGAVQNVTTAGTRVQLPDYDCREVTIIAKKTNTGSIYIGGSDVSSTVYGVELDANESITIAVGNTNLIYIDASVSGEGISYVAI